MKRNSVAIVGASETTELGKVPTMSQVQLHADAALNAIADAGLKLSDIDGVATGGHNAVEIAHYLGIVPKWLDGTSVGGCSFMLLVRHAAAAINEGLCETVLITHGESGRSNLGRHGSSIFPSLFQQQFERPFGVTRPPTMFTIPVLRYMKDYGLSEETLAMVSVVQREWASKNPRASFRDPITVDDVLNSKMICYPFRLLMCCLVTDGGGALILTKSERAKDLAQPSIDESQVEEAIKVMLEPFNNEGGENPGLIYDDIRDMMQSKVGIIRTKEELDEAIIDLKSFEERRTTCYPGSSRKYNSGWHQALDLKNMLLNHPSK